MWQPSSARWDIPKHLRPWLNDPGSLTARLNALGRAPIKVQVLRQSWGRPRLSEARTLGLRTSKTCLIREVVLYGPRQQPWVFARSLFPAASLTGALRHLRQLDSRPLGGYLFTHARLGRSKLQLALIPPTGIIPAALQGDTSLWGRRSVFTLYGKKLLVSETFLPDLEQTLQRNT
ncbi:chorismate lyase [Gilvimarinus sp. SDUM040013]|uniref:Probable chorismate pyruvate-lyase n=1 Tax=Gilvimarinus gilvus TaxID=3058038 RepID=A0ABU4RXA8_9GAMM|nr:chorismate lyase [Gilvimarinus sp. SDUM040013]MDO3388631.1 chorismate lyase [Gilvimarinus sp. SDUM040013]MDX6849526.1 chorismate lyase [Gilvimarinus sp. SDUM040013]